MSFNPLTMLNQLGKFREDAKLIEEKLENLQVTGNAAGLVHITLNGKLDLIDIKIDPIAVDDRDIAMLETLIKSAFLDAQQKAKQSIASELGNGDLSALSSLFNR